MAIVAVSTSLDDLRSQDMRFLDEASKLGELHVRLWSDSAVQAVTGKPPKFPQDERLYFAEAIKFVSCVAIVDLPDGPDALPAVEGSAPKIWAVNQASDTPAKKQFCQSHHIDYRVISDAQLQGFPDAVGIAAPAPGRKKALVTGCYDWVHTGHVRFFEEVSEHGDVYAVVGHDKNIEFLKGPGHPQFPQQLRRYMVDSIKYVRQGLIASGDGWLDAEPEIRRIKPDIYAVNEDGDKPEKREYCEKNGIQYLVLKRLPKPGLPRRMSTDLRGF